MRTPYRTLLTKRNLIIIVPILISATLLSLGWWLLSPSYIELSVPITSNGTGYFWWDTQRSSLAYADEPGLLYVSRKAGTAYTDTQGWKTREEVIGYFDKWLNEHGWERTDIYTSGDPALPESQFLKFGEGYVVYTMLHDAFDD